MACKYCFQKEDITTCTNCGWTLCSTCIKGNKGRCHICDTLLQDTPKSKGCAHCGKVNDITCPNCTSDLCLDCVENEDGECPICEFLLDTIDKDTDKNRLDSDEYNS